MKSDFDIINYSFKEEIKLIAIADLHYGSKCFDSRKWKMIKEKIISTPDLYVVIIGDMIDNQTRNSHEPFDNTVRPMEQKLWLVKELVDIKDKILAIAPGNHENKKDNKSSDDNILFDVAYKLGIEDRYRDNMAFIKIQLGDRNEHYRQTYTFGITHGVGGGNLTGTSVNRNERFGMVFDGLDCLITAHSHKPALTKPSKIVIDSKNNVISEKPFWQIIATSFVNYGGYALKGQLNPSSFMEQEITLKKEQPKNLEIRIK